LHFSTHKHSQIIAVSKTAHVAKATNFVGLIFGVAGFVQFDSGEGFGAVRLKAEKARKGRTKERNVKLIPHDNGSIAALNELGDFAISSPQLANRIYRFLQIGAPIFRCEVDHAATKITGNLVAIYEASDRLNTFLVALRAGRGGDFDDPLEIAISHDVSANAKTVSPEIYSSA